MGDLGILEKAIELVMVRASVSSGLIGRSSSANYSLRIRLDSLEMTADTLGVITTRKNATLSSIEWIYAGIETVHNELLIGAIKIAEERSTLICKNLAHKKRGIYSLTEKLRDQEFSTLSSGGAWMISGAKNKRAMSSDDLGLAVSHSKQVLVDLRIEYLVEPRDVE